MGRYNFRMSIAASLVVPFVFFVVSIIDINTLVRSEAPSSEGIMRTILDFSGGLASYVICMLLFLPAILVTSEHAGIGGTSWELVRYKNRDTYTGTVIRELLYFTTAFTVIVEALQLTLLLVFTDTETILSAGVIRYGIMTLVVGITFYYRALILYRIAKCITNQKALGMAITIGIYFMEYVLYTYIRYQSPIFPCYILTIPFRVLTGEVSMLSGSVYILVSIIANVAITLWLLVCIRGKDVIEHEK